MASCALLAAATAEAQNVPTGAAAEAEAVVRTAFAELDSLRWARAAALVHPETLAGFRSWGLQNARESERYRREPPPRDPGMPPEVAAWFEEQRRKSLAQEVQFGSSLSYQFAGIDSLAQLEALSAEELFARHLQASDPRELLRRQVMESGSDVPPEALTDIESTFHAQRTVIGATVENDSTVHVVYRTRFPGTPDEADGSAALVEVRRTPAGWRLWTAAHDRGLFADQHAFGFAMHVVTEEEMLVQRMDLGNRVVTWPLEGGGEGRAFVIGYTGGDEPPEALAIEVFRTDGTKVQVEVPYSSFDRLAELLLGWPDVQLVDRRASVRRP